MVDVIYIYKDNSDVPCNTATKADLKPDLNNDISKKAINELPDSAAGVAVSNLNKKPTLGRQKPGYLYI